MATNRGRKPEGNALTPDEIRDGDTSADIPMDPRPEDDQAVNADEARAVDDPAPEWAGEGSVPEVMTARDQRRAGVLDRLRGNAGHVDRPRSTDSAGGIVVVGPATAWLDSTLRASLVTDTDGAAHAIEDIVGRVQNATTLEELLADDQVMDAGDLIGVKLQIWGYKVNESDFEEGMPGYMLIDAIRRETGEKILFTCGAFKVQAQMLRAHTLGLFPFTAHIVRNETKGGKFPLGLVLDKD